MTFSSLITRSGFFFMAGVLPLQSFAFPVTMQSPAQVINARKVHLVSGDYTTNSRGVYVWQTLRDIGCYANEDILNGNFDNLGDDLDVRNLPAVANFAKGTILFANAEPAGFSVIQFSSHPEVTFVKVRFVTLQKEIQNCLVPNNASFIYPVLTSLDQ